MPLASPPKKKKKILSTTLRTQKEPTRQLGHKVKCTKPPAYLSLWLTLSTVTHHTLHLAGHGQPLIYSTARRTNFSAGRDLGSETGQLLTWQDTDMVGLQRRKLIAKWKFGSIFSNVDKIPPTFKVCGFRPKVRLHKRYYTLNWLLNSVNQIY